MKILLFLLMVICILILYGLIFFSNSANAELVNRFWCVLDGDQQVPPNNTHGHGFVGLKFIAVLAISLFSIPFLAMPGEFNSTSNVSSIGTGGVGIMAIFAILYLIFFIWQIFNARKLARKFNEIVRTTHKEPW